MNELGRCVSCRHWVAIEDGAPGSDALLGEVDYDAYYAGKAWDECRPVQTYEVRFCAHPRLVFFKRPDEDAAALVDGSEYFARLATGPAFGCTLHEAQPSTASVPVTPTEEPGTDLAS